MAESSSVPRITNPNILVVVVDQMRYPVWLTPEQVAVLETTVAPTIFGDSIRKNSVVFKQYFTASNRCTPARGTMLTGLYSHQTYLMAANNNESSPYLNPGFWTYAHALPQVNSAYTNKVYWFGKWHASLYNVLDTNPLGLYGFRMHPFQESPWHDPGYIRDPYGWANEGVTGGNNSTHPAPLKRPTSFVADEDIATNFQQWLNTQPQSGWCATVSFINPHDISFYPGYFRPDWDYPTEGAPGIPDPFAVNFPFYYDPPPDNPPGVQQVVPDPWNNESDLSMKPSFQTQFRTFLDNMNHAVPQSRWHVFLDYYWYLHQYVDAQIKRVLDAVAAGGYLNNTIIVFTSDHGEYAGSHGLRGKGGGAYDEGIRVPLFVKFPNGVGTLRTQMCSTVDLFPFLCDLATDGGNWRTLQPNLAANYANRESIWNFIYNPLTTPQQRKIQALDQPYILHTTDEEFSADVVPEARYEITWRNHVVCLRTNSESGAHPIGGKLAHYYRWGCSDVPVTPLEVDKEFYKYAINRRELNNDWSSGDPLVQQYENELGTFGGAGLIESELRAPLIGLGPYSQSLQNVVRPAARNHYLNFRLTFCQ